MRKTFFCICENKDADQLRSNCAADQRLCFRYTDSTVSLLPESEITSLQPSSVDVQPGFCRTRLETPKTGQYIAYACSCDVLKYPFKTDCNVENFNEYLSPISLPNF